MKRPWPLRFFSGRARESLYYSVYHTQHRDWLDLFKQAPLTLAPGLSMCDLLPNDVISGSIAFTGAYELALSKRVLQLARTGGLLVDVGANMGYFSLLWAGANRTNRVVAFEASPRNVAVFENNVRRNDLSERIKMVRKAAGDHPGHIPFDLGPPDQTGWGGFSPTAFDRTIDVPVVRLDQELTDAQIDVLKIDVEGADTWVLRGCEALLETKRIGTIFFEQNRDKMNRLGIKEGEARTFLGDLGYSCTPLGAGDEEWIARAKT